MKIYCKSCKMSKSKLQKRKHRLKRRLRKNITKYRAKKERKLSEI